MSALARAGARLRVGSVRVCHARTEQVRTWAAGGRRDDLDGWKAALGSWLRLALLAAAGYAAFWACRRWPWLMWALAAWWCTVAWRAGAPRSAGKNPADEEAPAAAPETAAPTAPTALLVAAVRTLAAGGAGAHLKALAEHLTEETKRPWDTAAVRAACTAAGITVSDSVRQPGRGVSTGVRVDALPVPLSSPSPAPVVAVVVAGQDPPTAATTGPATAPELQLTVKEEAGITIILDPSERRAYKVGG